MRLPIAVALLTMAAAPVSCAFLLDFDELQKAEGSTPQDGGGDGSECNCVTTDPCKPQVCQQGQCVVAPLTGLAEDGYRAAFTAETSYRLTLTSFGNAFYGSFFSDAGPKNELRFFKVGFNEQATPGQPPLSKLSADLATSVPLQGLATALPASAAGLSTTGLALNAAFATTTGQVYGLKLNSDLEPQVGSGLADATAPYEIVDPYRHPYTWVSADKPFIGWISTAGRVRVVEGVSTNDFGNGAVTAFAPLSTPGGAAVAWVENGVFIQHQDQAAPTELIACLSTQAWQHFSLSTFGIGFGAQVSSGVIWSKTDGTNWDTLSKTVYCSPNNCVPSPNTTSCSDPGTVSGIRDLSVLAFRIPAQPVEKFFEVVAYAVESSSGRQIKLAAIEYDLNNETVRELGETLSLTEIEPQTVAGDWPVIAFSGLDQVLVGWIQPRDPDPDEAHLRRFKLCL